LAVDHIFLYYHLQWDSRRVYEDSALANLCYHFVK